MEGFYMKIGSFVYCADGRGDVSLPASLETESSAEYLSTAQRQMGACLRRRVRIYEQPFAFQSRGNHVRRLHSRLDGRGGRIKQDSAAAQAAVACPALVEGRAGFPHSGRWAR